MKIFFLRSICVTALLCLMSVSEAALNTCGATNRETTSLFTLQADASGNANAFIELNTEVSWSVTLTAPASVSGDFSVASTCSDIPDNGHGLNPNTIVSGGSLTVIYGPPASLIIIFIENSTPGATFNITLLYDVINIIPPAFILEDPHIKSWDGLPQTVFGQGDYVLATSPSTGMSVHGRFCLSPRGGWASWTCSLAVRCRSDSTPVEISAADWVVVKGPEAFVSVKEVDAGQLRISCAQGLDVLLMRQRFHRHRYMNVQMQLLPHAPADLQGLLGTPNRDRSDDVQPRNKAVPAVEAGEGHFIAHSLTELDDVHNSWRVTDSEKLFRTEFVPLNRVHPAVARAVSFTQAQRQASESSCRAAGLTTEIDLAICVHDALTAKHVEGAKNLAAFLKAAAQAQSA